MDALQAFEIRIHREQGATAWRDDFIIFMHDTRLSRQKSTTVVSSEERAEVGDGLVGVGPAIA